MGKKILITSTDLMMVQFLVPHVKNLSENGYEVEIACSDVGGRVDEIRQKLDGYIKEFHIVDLVRSPFSLGNLKGYRQMKQIIKNGGYDIVWTNEPVMGIVTRLAARKHRKNGLKVMYMAHGFHFYKGAPLINWMLYYPVEKIMSSKTDLLVTVNKEDYARSQKMRAKKVEYIHGIGIDTSRLENAEENSNIREELGLGEDEFIIVSVGELNENKNHKVIIKALAKLNDKNVHYVICGKGDKLDELTSLAKELAVDENVHFLGYRKDIAGILKKSDVFAMPSYREGLPVSTLEAMLCGLPVLSSKIRGLVDVMEDDVSGYMYSPNDADGFADGLAKLRSDPDLRSKMGARNIETVKPFCIEETKVQIENFLNEF